MYTIDVVYMIPNSHIKLHRKIVQKMKHANLDSIIGAHRIIKVRIIQKLFTTVLVTLSVLVTFGRQPLLIPPLGINLNE